LYRYPDNPIITRQDIKSRHPALQDVSSVFNPGGVRHEGQFLLLLRVQNRARETFFVKALSEDGIHFSSSDLPVQILHLERCKHMIYHIYDARITADTAGFYQVFCAMDTDKGCFLGYFRSEDFDSLDFIGLASEPDTRNGVLLPGTDYRFERPNKHVGTDGVKTGSRIVCSKSRDMLHWQEVAEVFSGRPHYWDELIGSGLHHCSVKRAGCTSITVWPRTLAAPISIRPASLYKTERGPGLPWPVDAIMYWNPVKAMNLAAKCPM